MVWIVCYLLVGMACALYTPIKQASARRSLDALTPSQLASIHEDDRKILTMSSDTLRTTFTTRQLVLGGLLWPLQLTLVIAVEFYFLFRRHRH